MTECRHVFHFKLFVMNTHSHTHVHATRLLLDRRCLIGTSTNPRDRTSRNRSRGEYDEATAYDSYMNPEPGFRAGPGDSYDAA